MSVYLKRQTGSEAFPPDYIEFSAADEILSITGVFCALALVVIMVRVYVRAWMLRFFGPDDWTIMLAMALSVAVFVCFLEETKHGLGKHAVVMMMDTEGYLNFSKLLYAHSVIIMVAVSAVKVSIALFLMRLAHRTTYVRFLWGTIVFLVLFTISCAGTLIFQCTPVAAAWDYSLRLPPNNAKCFSMTTFRNIGLFNSIVNIITDFLFASLPIPLVFQLQVNLRTKMTLVSILSLGFFASAAAIVKCIKQWNVLTDTDWTVHNSFNVWNYIELNIGIVAASLPALKPLFTWFLDTARAITSSGGGNRRGTGYNTYGRSASLGYQKQADSSGFALTSMSRSRGDSEAGKIDAYVAKVSVGGKEHGKFDSRLGRGAPVSPDGSRDSAGTVAKEVDKGWDPDDARKNSDEGILPHGGTSSRPRGHVILRTTEVHVS